MIQSANKLLVVQHLHPVWPSEGNIVFLTLPFLSTGTVENGITISMEEYAKSMMIIEDIREAKAEDPLTKTEMKMYRKYTGKLSWLVVNTHPYLSITALMISNKNRNATIKDIKKINHVLKKVPEKPNHVDFTKIGNKEEMVIFGLTYASFKNDDKSVSGILILMGNKRTNQVN
jgi:hypothetical protein